jgi:hypothetical protein
MATYVGTVQEVLIDAAHPQERGAMNGRTDGFRPITVRGGELEIGDMVRVRVTEHRAHWLTGENQIPPAPLFLGSCPNSGECLSDFQEEVLIISVSIGHAFDDFYLVVDAFQDAGVQGMFAVGQDSGQVGF